MNPIVLRNKTPDGELLEATFLPDKGMNMMSFKRGNLEVIDQSTRNLFEERYAGLGALIGPHFHHRRPEALPSIKDKQLFPHMARVSTDIDPFSHGIGRYAPWQAKSTDTKVTATISGKDTWNGVPLAALEGQNFKMEFTAELTSTGLHLALSVVSDADSIVGIHYYYHLPQGTGTVTSRVQRHYLTNNVLTPIPETWNKDEQQTLRYSLDQPIDGTFFPFPNPLEGKILLDAGDYKLETAYQCDSQENSWQLWHPSGASYVCIEPLSAQDPRHPNLTVSSLNIHLAILKGAI